MAGCVHFGITNEYVINKAMMENRTVSRILRKCMFMLCDIKCVIIDQILYI